MIAQREITVAFTGHRTYDGSIDEAVENAVRRLYDRGFRVFLTGMAAGFDLSAGECVARLKAVLPGLQLHCVVPFAGHRSSMSGDAGRRYDRLLDVADEVTTLAIRYDSRVYHRRNDFLVENSSAVIAYFDGRKGGTEYTVRRAVSMGLEVDNLWLGMFRDVQF